MNILDKAALHECTSCQLCATMCARGAIKIGLNKDGFYRPVVDADLCTDCGLCTKVCYKFDENLRTTEVKPSCEKELFSAWATDDKVVKETTSGGLGDLLAHELLSKGYKVVGCAYDNDKERAEHRIASTEEDLIPFRGSKYIQSYNFEAFKEVVRNCRQEKYAVFGTPCQIYALSRIAEIKKVRDQVFFVDIYCHGCPSLFAWRKYVDSVKAKTEVDKFDKVEFRSKSEGWGVYCASFYKNGKRLFKSNRNLRGFFELFFCDHILNDGCNTCQLRFSLEYTDIRLGDFWGKKYVGNTRGVSAVTICSNRGRAIWEELDKSILECEFESLADFLPSQSWGKTHHPDAKARAAILESLRDGNQTIDSARKVLYRHQTTKETLVRYIKNVLALLPRQLSIAIKKIR